MAITDKEQGVWELDQVYNKIKSGGIWNYTGQTANMTWGQNSYGYRGLNDVVVRSSPVQLPGSWNIHQGRVQPSVTLATNSDGELFSWGGNWYGTCGLNDEVHRSSPTQVGTDTTWSTTREKNMCVGDVSIAVKTDGTMWSWGRNMVGVLGHNEGGYPGVMRSSPTQIGSADNWSAVGAAGADNILALKPTGELFSWGFNYWGYLGQNDRVSYSSPNQIPGTTWSKLAGGASVKMAQKTDGKLWMWAYNAYGQLGQNDRVNRSTPVAVGAETDWTSFDNNDYAAAAINTSGELYTLGYNTLGFLGHNDRISHSSPNQIPGTNWSEVVVGGSGNTNTMMMGIKSDSSLWTWGANYTGMLGHNKSGSDQSGLSSPTQIPGTWSEPRGGMYGCYAKASL